MRALMTLLAVLQVGAPAEVRVSHPSDERAHPAARTESWEMLAVDPQSRLKLLIRLRHSEGLSSASVALADGVNPPTIVEPDIAFEGGDASGARFRGPDSSATASWSRGRVSVALAGPQASGTLTLTGRPGPFAGPWRLGEAIRYPQAKPERVRVNYNVPVAAGRLTGRLTLEGRSFDLTGWRGSWEHTWGSWTFIDDNWRHWDAYTVHRGRTAWLAFGLNRADTVLGFGARDAQWLGVLARVSPRGTRICRPKVDRRAWAFGAIPDDPVAHRLTARCRGLRVTFTEPSPLQWLRDDDFIGFRQQANPAVAKRGRGIARHDSHTN
jgi:hypothetical protein